MTLFDEILENCSNNYIKNFITPITPYFICNHFIGTEIYNNNSKYINININIEANDLLNNKNYDEIKNHDIIQIQVDYFNYFYDNILPIICNNDRYIIIITSQWHLPQIQQNEKTDNCLNNKNILLWISQNPIYQNHHKYMAFPYGICQLNIDKYIDYLKFNNIDKNNLILNQYSNPHYHLPENHIRKKYAIFGINSGSSLNYYEYLENILHSKFVISTTGDREDTYRHYECIGLESIPISNISLYYKNIFEENMIYSSAEEMIKILENNNIDNIYFKPNRDILTTIYWKNKIRKKLDEIL